MNRLQQYTASDKHSSSELVGYNPNPHPFKQDTALLVCTLHNHLTLNPAQQQNKFLFDHGSSKQHTSYDSMAFTHSQNSETLLSL